MSATKRYSLNAGEMFLRFRGFRQNHPKKGCRRMKNGRNVVTMVIWGALALLFAGVVCAEECDIQVIDFHKDWPKFTIELRAPAEARQVTFAEWELAVQVWAKGEPGAKISAVELGVWWKGEGELRGERPDQSTDPPPANLAALCCDSDGDGLVTMADYEQFSGCVNATGAVDDCPETQFLRHDTDCNGVVDLVDFSSFQTLLGRADLGVPCNCWDSQLDPDRFRWLFSAYFDSHEINRWRQNSTDQDREGSAWWQAGASFGEDFIIPEGGEKLLVQLLFKIARPGAVQIWPVCGYQSDYYKRFMYSMVLAPMGDSSNFLEAVGGKVDVQLLPAE